MAKDPAVLWYWNDWIGGTMTMSRALKGAYMDLLGAQHNTGALSLEEIKTVLGSDFGSMWPTLQKKFAKGDNGLYFNERAQRERESRKTFTDSRKKNLRKSSPHMGDHMENENRDEDLSDFQIENKKGGAGGKKQDYIAVAVSILIGFNEITGRKYDPNNPTYLKLVCGRLAEGATPEQAADVSILKSAEWKGTDMDKYISPATIFTKDNYWKYVGQVNDAKERGLTASQIRGSNGHRNINGPELMDELMMNLQREINASRNS